MCTECSFSHSPIQLHLAEPTKERKSRWSENETRNQIKFGPLAVHSLKGLLQLVKSSETRYITYMPDIKNNRIGARAFA
jgi:hypothetical protein